MQPNATNGTNQERKVRAKGSTQLITPPVYDCTQDKGKPRYQNGLDIPAGFPRFLHRICDTDSPTYHPITRETGFARYLQVIEGYALLIEDTGKTTFLTAGSCLYIGPNVSCDLLLGRGPQNWLTAFWEPKGIYVPNPTDEITVFNIHSCSPTAMALSNLIELQDGMTDEVPHLLLGWLNIMLHERVSPSPSFRLTHTIENGDESLGQLIQAIIREPHTEWSLARAAKVAGYSPFHLSRLFRAQVNVGLPKFVELCRTEIAIHLILETDTSMLGISESCGFGTPQAMRTAIREHTGFLPTELRGRTGE